MIVVFFNQTIHRFSAGHYSLYMWFQCIAPALWPTLVVCCFGHIWIPYLYSKCCLTTMTFLRSVYKHTHLFNGPLSGTTQVSGTRKEKPIWILLKQETVSGSGIHWAICKSARCSQVTMPASHHSVFYRPDALPAAQPTVSKHCMSVYKIRFNHVPVIWLGCFVTAILAVVMFLSRCMVLTC